VKKPAISLEQVRFHQECGHRFRGVYNDAGVMWRGLSFASMAVAHLVSKRSQSIGDHHEATNHVFEAIVEVWAFIIHPQAL
jgi:hypothetical protein